METQKNSRCGDFREGVKMWRFYSCQEAPEHLVNKFLGQEQNLSERFFEFLPACNTIFRGQFPKSASRHSFMASDL